MSYIDDQVNALNKQIAYQQQILNDSDKYIIRSVELSQPVYPQITALRATARAAITGFQAQVASLLAYGTPNPPDLVKEINENPAAASAATVVEQIDQSLPL